MIKEKWHDFEWIWTTHADEYALLHFNSLGIEHEVIFHIPSAKILTIEDDDVSEAVKEKMRQEGIKSIDNDYVRKLLGR